MEDGMAADTQILKGETHTEPGAQPGEIQRILELFLDSLVAEQTLENEKEGARS